MRFKVTTAILAFLYLSQQAFAQDIHFSQFYFAPLTVNPSLTGNFYGTMRIGGIYRSQWSNMMTRGYTTPSFYIDAPVIRGFRKQDWVGAGGVVYTDQAGAGRLSTGGFLFSGAYHLGLGAGAKHIVSIGAQYGLAQRQLRDAHQLRFEDGIEAGPGGVSQDQSNIANDNQRFNEVVAGVTYGYKLNANDRIQAGFSLAHLTRGRATVMSTGGGYRLPFRYTGHATADLTFAEVWKLRPGLLVQSFDSHLEIQGQAVGGLVLNQEEEIVLNAGLGYRVGDAMIVLAGMEYKTLRVGIAFDSNASGLGQGNAIEIGASYIIRIVKKPKVRPVLFCPRL